ncbi:hypothetical protein [Candidatus Pseudothioglobus sp. Uisw_086]|uniref:hypothetical protein n=1 Tax=Candidatus Pseudothioglobus sp. Uisw_086 TaxID=3230998 RepID=UPI003A84BB96
MQPKNISYQDHEIDSKELINFLFESKKFIFTITSFLSIIAILYTLSLPQIIPTYKSHIYFLKPSQETILELNKMLVSKETQQSVFYKFLTKAMSKKFQNKIFKEKNYFNNINNPVTENDVSIKEYINSIKTLDDDNHEKSKLAAYEVPWTISITGGDPTITSTFLNDLVVSADKELLKELKDSSKIEASSRIEEIAIERSVILKANEINNNFNRELLELNIEEAKLNLLEFNPDLLALVQIDQLALPPKTPIKKYGRKRSVILIFHIFGSFMLSIFLVLIRNIYRFNKNEID